MKHLKILAFLGTCTFLLPACDSISEPDTAINFAPQTEATGNITNSLATEGNFTILADALNRTGLNAALADETRDFTIFAPVDQAFAGLGEETLGALFSDTQTLSYILLNHVLQDQNVNSATAGSLVGSTVTAGNGQSLPITVAASRNNPDIAQALYVGEGEIFVADIPATNGTIHVVDRVLLPADVGGATSGQNTNGGQNNNDGSQTNNTSNSTDNSATTDTDTSNTNQADGSLNLMQVLAADAELSTLVDALNQTGLNTLLTDNSQSFTILAPKNTAFETYNSFNNLFDDSEKLKQILLYHVIQGITLDAANLNNRVNSSITMANSQSIYISSFNNKLFANYYAGINQTDIRASNGIVHKLEGILYPR